jgi:hypothetical protein
VCRILAALRTSTVRECLLRRRPSAVATSVLCLRGSAAVQRGKEPRPGLKTSVPPGLEAGSERGAPEASRGIERVISRRETSDLSESVPSQTDCISTPSAHERRSNLARALAGTEIARRSGVTTMGVASGSGAVIGRAVRFGPSATVRPGLCLALSCGCPQAPASLSHFLRLLPVAPAT